jgi:hypothetical protein
LKKCLQRPPKRALNLGALSKIVLQARNSRSSETTFVDRKDEYHRFFKKKIVEKR